MEKYIYNGKNGLYYKLIGDYYYPCLTVLEPPCIGIWGMRRLQYLKEHKKILYQTLFYTAELNAHLEEIDHSAEEMIAQLIKQLAVLEGITEALKAADQMEWVLKMNNVYNRTKEIVYNELISEQDILVIKEL